MRSLIFITLFFLGTLCSNAQTPKDTLLIGIYDAPPFVMVEDDLTVGGVSGWLWEKLNRELTQPYKFVHYQSDQPLNDLIDDITNGKIDLSINPITITSSRDKNMTFTYPFFIGDLTIARKHQPNFESFLNILGSIFNKRILVLMLVLIGLVILFGCLIWLIERKNEHFGSGPEGFSSSLWWAAVTMTTVGYGDKVPISNKGRFIAFVWMVLSIIMIAIFTASTTSTLTVRELNNADYSLANYKQNSIGTISNSATEDYLRRNFFRNVETFSELKIGLEALRNEEIEFFVYDQPWLKYQIDNNPEFETLEIMPVRFKMQPYAMPMRKDIDPELRNSISSLIISMLESKEWELLLKEFELRQE